MSGVALGVGVGSGRVRIGRLRPRVRDDGIEALLGGGVQVVLLLVEVVQQAPDEPVGEERGNRLGLAQRQQGIEQPEPEVPPLVRPRHEETVLASHVPQRLNRARNLHRVRDETVPH